MTPFSFDETEPWPKYERQIDTPQKTFFQLSFPQRVGLRVVLRFGGLAS